jgi:signal transduction histidine kinase
MALATAVVGTALVLRVLDVAAGRFSFGTAWLPPLFAAGGLVSAALLARRIEPAAWFATVAAAAISALEIVGVVRSHEAAMGAADWPVAVSGTVLALVAAAAIAAAYALRRPPGAGRRAPRMAWRAIVLVGFGVVLAGGGLALATAPGISFAFGVDLTATTDHVGALRLSGRIAAAFIGVATLGGIWLDLAGPVARASGRSPTVAAFPRALADELLPTSTASRRRGVEDERARLAAELHARILPDLRRAAEAAEATGTASDPLAIGLRRAVEDVEELMHARQSVVLEEYGLVAALEWLAERTQQRSPLAVDLELDGADVDSPTAVPKPVARAAFRIALLAVDNVVRHAGAARTVIRLTVDAHRVALEITDDGRGFEPGTGRASGRGLVDMRAAAAEIGATLRVQPQPQPQPPGTSVQLTWERGRDAAGTVAADEPPNDLREPTARPGLRRA